MKTETIPARPWLVPGAELARVGGSDTSRVPTASKVTLKSVGKRYAILTDGERFDMAVTGYPTSSRGSGWHSFTHKLMPLDAPEVRKLALRQRMESARRKAEEHLVQAHRTDVLSIGVGHLRTAAEWATTAANLATELESLQELRRR